MKSVFAKAFLSRSQAIRQIIGRFESDGTLLVKGKRNTLKTFPLDDLTINVKAFKVPNFFNAIVYRYFRPSKARRSFEYAQRLIELGIGTPQPVAYFEQSGLLMGKSFYVSEHLDADFTFRALVDDLNLPDRENIAKAFAEFFFKVHEAGVEFIDNTPGNTLIVRKPDGYAFFLVDLNRMKFHRQMTHEQRLRNLSKITRDPSLLEPIAQRYAALSNADAKQLKSTLSGFVDEFQSKLQRRKELKKKLKLK